MVNVSGSVPNDVWKMEIRVMNHLYFPENKRKINLAISKEPPSREERKNEAFCTPFQVNLN